MGARRVAHFMTGLLLAGLVAQPAQALDSSHLPLPLRQDSFTRMGAEWPDPRTMVARVVALAEWKLTRIFAMSRWLAETLKALTENISTLDLTQVLVAVMRLHHQQTDAISWLAGVSAAKIVRFNVPGQHMYQRRILTLPISHRSVPLSVVVIEPVSGGNHRLVIISHGLWDNPQNFEGWARHLASHGYTVLLPDHPGSDTAQQQAMLLGQAPPPSPQELMLRPRDITALITAAGEDRLALQTKVDTSRVLAVGHSWGALTVLQLAGAKPNSYRLRRDCNNLKHPSYNLSWVLQCSFLVATDQASLADRRVRSVVAVSPPIRLLLSNGSTRAVHASVLLVSGTQDWVVPVGPEAIDPMLRLAKTRGLGPHRLVLADGGDHFNLRAPATAKDSPLNGLILAWFASNATLPADGWGHRNLGLRDVTIRLSRSAARR